SPNRARGAVCDPDNLYVERVHGCGRADFLWQQSCDRISSGRRLHRTNSARCQTGRSASHAANALQAHHQSQSCPSPRPDDTRDAASPRRRGARMKRREFIRLLGGAAATWPLGARAQTGKLVRLGYLEGGARADPTTQNLRRQFVLGMRDLGYNEGRDYLLEERYAGGQLDSFPAYAQELVQLPVDIIVAG